MNGKSFMNKNCLILFSIFVFQTAIGQVYPTKPEDPYKMEIEEHNFRGMLNFVLENKLEIAVNYEHKIIKPFTFLIKTGLTSVAGHVYNDEAQIELSAMGSVEFRYYFNLKRRIRLAKTVRNYSASYISIEPFARTNPLVIYDNPGEEETPGRFDVYLNIGFQRQFKRSYFAAFAGVVLRDVYDESNGFNFVRIGFSIGRVL